MGLGLLGAGPARAAPAAPVRSPTAGVDRPYHDYASEGDASSLELNPALLVAARGAWLTLLGYHATGTFMRGSGFGGFASLALPWNVAFGLGAQLLVPDFGDGTFDAHAALNPRATKLSLGIAVGDPRYGSFGVGLHGTRVLGDWVRRPDLDVGVLTRITNYASFGANLRLGPVDMRSELFGSELDLVAELAIRPLGTRLLELAGGIRHRFLEGAPGAEPDRLGVEGLLGRGRIALRLSGLALRGEVEQVRVQRLDRGTLEPLRVEKGVRGSVSLEAAWDFASLAAGLHAGLSDEGVDGWGFSASLHTRRRGRAYGPRPVALERLEIAGVVDQRSLLAMLARIDRARRAGRRSVLLVDARDVEAGWASLHELRRALARVRNAGGHVYGYVEDADLRDYYVASVAEKVFIHPGGELQTVGLATQTLYFKGALDRLGVQAEVVRVGEYKSAAERFTETGPSPADRRQRSELLHDVFHRVVFDIAQARRRPIAEVREVLVDGAPHGAEQAVQAGWVDAVAFRDRIAEEISTELGTKVRFASVPDTRPEDPTWSVEPYIGVVVVEGTIVDGESRTIPILDLQYVGDRTINGVLQELRADPACRGIVVRVDSPGGSALASEAIWREVALTHEAHQQSPRSSPPIVVSMSNYAASGGYYLSVAARPIFADPMTLTGSIGVIRQHWDVSGLLHKLGITVGILAEGEHATLQSIYRPWSPEERALAEASIRRTYALFVERVAAGRDLEPDRVDALAKGRVYSGVDALDVGLVDAMGDLHDAVALARERAGVPDFRELPLRVFPEPQTLIDLLLDFAGDPQFGQGPLRTAVRKRREARAAQRMAAVAPAALRSVLARLPLSRLYLRADRNHAILPWVLTFD